MKLILSFFFSVLMICAYGQNQNTKLNRCWSGWSIKMIDEEAANAALQDKMATDYLNVIITTNGIQYKNELFKSYGLNELKLKIEQAKKNEVIIGIEVNSDDDAFVSLGCILSNFKSSIDNISLYFFE